MILLGGMLSTGNPAGRVFAFDNSSTNGTQLILLFK